MGLLIGLSVVGLVLWIICLFWNLIHARAIPRLAAAMEYPLPEHPLVSILIPARNEAEILSQSLPRFLAQDYDNYEVILVDDASTDDTSAVARQFAESFPSRLRVVRVEELPPGWVGKPYALQSAFQVARGDWVLATDADILFHPKALRAGVWAAAQQKADLVTIYAYPECGSFWEKLLLPVFGLLLATFFPIPRINNPRSSVALASGGYILMRRQVWASLGAYESIRSEMIDDLNTARIVKHSGHRIYAALTRDLLRTRMYAGLAELWEGLRKNAFAGSRFSVTRHLPSVGAMLLCNALPLVCIFFLGTALLLGRMQMTASVGEVLALSLAQYAFSVALHLPLVGYLRIGLGYALLAPLGASLYAGVSVDSMLRTLLGKGVSWKLRRYGRPSLGSEGR